MQIQITKKKRLTITARGWPWQKVRESWASSLDKTVGETYGWNPLEVKGMGRFGGGWAVKLGITISESFRDIVIDLLLGSLRVTLKEVKDDKN